MLVSEPGLLGLIGAGAVTDLFSASIARNFESLNHLEKLRPARVDGPLGGFTWLKKFNHEGQIISYPKLLGSVKGRVKTNALRRESRSDHF
jgi:hypothetical protein